jgi:hypothetical protein
MHENLSPKFFRLVSVGTPVNISRSQPEDATVSVPLPPDAGPLPDYQGTMYITDGYFNQHKPPVYQRADPRRLRCRWRKRGRLRVGIGLARCGSPPPR